MISSFVFYGTIYRKIPDMMPKLCGVLKNRFNEEFLFPFFWWNWMIKMYSVLSFFFLADCTIWSFFKTAVVSSIMFLPRDVKKINYMLVYCASKQVIATTMCFKVTVDKNKLLIQRHSVLLTALRLKHVNVYGIK